MYKLIQPCRNTGFPRSWIFLGTISRSWKVLEFSRLW